MVAARPARGGGMVAAIPGDLLARGTAAQVGVPDTRSLVSVEENVNAP
jgi:hypothetical protein